MIDSICESKLCTGCASCSQICPQEAVGMAANDEGFFYPCINTELCSDCGLCRKTCPVNKAISIVTIKQNKNECIMLNDDSRDKSTIFGSADLSDKKHLSDKQRNAYACYSKDEDTRSKSSSGGVFTQIAQSILSKNGVIFGAGFDGEFKVRHTYVENEKELDGLRRSKYVQSDTGNTFREARAFLKEGREVLFCGTPCQIAGLKAFLNREYENLLTCDLACHGVPSPKVWRMYLDYIKEKYKSSISAVSFRDKSTGWNSSSMKINFSDGSQYIDRVKKEIFFIGFGKSIFNRNSCYNCKFRIQNTKADITLADFWGIDKQNDSDFSDNKGVSLVITHNTAGENALSRIRGQVCIKQRTLDEAVQHNPRLVSSVIEPSGRKSFFDDMRAGHGFDRLRRKHMDNSGIKYWAKSLVKLILGRT